MPVCEVIRVLVLTRHTDLHTHSLDSGLLVLSSACQLALRRIVTLATCTSARVVHQGTMVERRKHERQDFTCDTTVTVRVSVCEFIFGNITLHLSRSVRLSLSFSLSLSLDSFASWCSMTEAASVRV